MTTVKKTAGKPAETGITPAAAKIIDEAVSFQERFQNFEVTDRSDLEIGAHWLSQIKAKAKELDDQRKELTRPLDESKKKIMELFRRPLAALEAAEYAIKQGIKTYQDALQVEQERIAASLKAEEEKRRAELEAKAKEAAEFGDTNTAAELAKQAARVQAPVVSKVQTGISGLQYRDNWKAEVYSLESLIDWCQKNPKYLPIFLQANERKLNEYAKISKGDLEIGGVKFTNERIIASGRAA